MQLDEQCKEFQELLRVCKLKLKEKLGGKEEEEGSQIFGEINETSSLQPADQSVGELKRVNAILMKAKESQFKKSQHMKAKFEKKIQKLEDEVTAQKLLVQEKEKENRILVLKLKESLRE